MGMFLNPGNIGFSSAVRSEIYVDKTDLIQFTNKVIGTEQRFICVSRPRRFGKSMAAKMLIAYYSCGCDSDKLFRRYKISKESTYKTELNKNNVIYMDIQWFRSVAKDKQDSNQTITYMQTEVIKELRVKYPDVVTEDDISLPEVLLRIYSVTGEQFIIIIDEWDCLFREDKDNKELQDIYINFMRGLFKGGPAEAFIKLAYITGILPIKKYGTQSALNNFDEYTMINPSMLAKYVGFTEDEVERLCQDYHMGFEEAKHWYDGYSFNKVKSVYSPNSVVEAMRNESFENYWTQTETYEALKIYIDMDKDGLKEAIMQMLGGAKYPIDSGTFQNDMTSIESKDDIFTLLVHLGYLAYDAEYKSVFIPNEEVRQEFIRAVKAGKHTEIAKMISESDKLLQDTINMNADKVAAAIERTHSALTAPIFYNNEQALRSVIRFAYISCVDEFKDIQELPSGIGYADIVYIPKKKSSMPIILIELKWDKSVDGAIKQIKDRNYAQVWDDYGSDILLVGINYDTKTKKHECIIEKYQK